MRFEVPIQSFAVAVGKVEGVASKTDVRPVLHHYKCRAEADGTVRLRATDTRVMVEYVVGGATVTEPGEAILLSDRVGKIVREHSVGTLHIDANEERVKARCVEQGKNGPKDTGKYTLPVMPVDQFPDLLDELEEKPVVRVWAGDLAKMVQRTTFAAAKKEKEKSRWTLTGTLLQVDPSGRLVMAATDGDVMAESLADATVEEGVLGENGKAISAILPPAALRRVVATLPDDGDEVCIRFDQNQILFRFSTGAVLARQLDGQFPPHRAFLYKIAPTITFDLTEAFWGCMRRAAITLDDLPKRVLSKRVDVRFEGGDDPTAVMTAVGSAVGGDAESACPLPEFAGEGGMTLGMLADLIADMHRAVGKEGKLTGKVWKPQGEKPPVFLAEYEGGLATCSLMAPK